jgi:hypothetical protein
MLIRRAVEQDASALSAIASAAEVEQGAPDQMFVATAPGCRLSR